MKQSEALEWVRRLQFAIQKDRSIATENGLAEIGELLNPWFWGEKCLLKATQPILERGIIEPSTLYNLMFIANRDENRPLLNIQMVANNMPGFPKPDTAWMLGWDDE